MPVKLNTLESLIRALAPGLPKIVTRWERLLEWPPDVFGITAYILHKTGAYRHVIDSCWCGTSQKMHAAKMNRLGIAWRKALAGGRPVPAPVLKLWHEVVPMFSLAIMALDQEANKKAIIALLDLLAAADSACEKFGVPHKRDHSNKLEEKLLDDVEAYLADQILNDQPSTLARQLDPQMICVLPKIRTPQTGLTIRSLSHHLAMWPRDETSPHWNIVRTPQTLWDTDRLNLLLVPWPYEVKPEQFQASTNTRCGRHFMNDLFGCFEYHPEDCAVWIENEFPFLLKAAVEKTDEKAIHGVVFPELAFACMDHFVAAYEKVQISCPEAFLLAGVCQNEATPATAGNFAWFAAPLLDGGNALYTQAKHHRWQLDGSQIKRYQLASQLQTAKLWWESTIIAPRAQNILALKKSMTFSFLICEDLARQEPAARLLRSVGPNLIIALLLDGQQLEGRWPGRYASVLAEDPGSSILTVTSLGMVLRGKSSQELENDARQRKKRKDKRHESCNIGLWRDKNGSATAVSIDPEDQGVVLSLTWEKFTEFSADGRSAEASALIMTDPKQDILPIRLAK